MTARERIHRAMRAVVERAGTAPWCETIDAGGDTHSMLCDALVEEFEPADPAMPPPDVIASMAKGCRCCSECEEPPPCAGCMAGGVCDHDRCTCGESDEDLGDDFDPLACPGCGGNCQVACR